MTLNHKSFGDGKPLVILHGLLGSLDNWVTVSKYLAKKYKVYIIDLPNHGKSYHTKYFSYENMANDLDSFFVENGLTKFSLLGHSMGGKLALKYVDMFEDKIDKLILVDIANKNYESTRFNNVFDAIFSISLNNLETRKDADSIVSEIIKNEGERHFVLKNLKTRNINLPKKEMKIMGKRKKERIIPLHQQIISQIKKYLDKKNEIKSTHEFLLCTNKGKKLYPMLIYRIVKKHLSSLINSKKYNPHLLRHTFATHILNKGGDLNSIKDLLGHESLAATQIYTHNSIEKLKETFKASHPRA